jgi:uncharacterized protein YjbI with pentapeptide repeats
VREERSVGQRKLRRKPYRRRRWRSYLGFRGKTVWDWLPIGIAFLIPLVIALGTWRITTEQGTLEDQRAQAERELAEQRAQDEALQAYLDQMTSLLLEKNLRESEKGSEVRILAQARTATVIQALDGDGNRNVIRFLKEARLTGNIYGETPSAISLLTRTDLQGARLEGADLSGIDLAYTILDDAHLRGTAPEWLPSASLAKADMSRTYLEDCNLVGATLDNAILRDAYLYGANLSSATLKDADLSGANVGGAVVKSADLTGADLTATNLRSERTNLVVDACAHTNELLEALRKLVSFLEHGRANYWGPAATKVVSKDIAAAILRDVDGLTNREIGEHLGVPSPADFRIKADHPTVRKMVGRGRRALKAALGEDGYIEHVRAMKEEAEAWRSRSPLERQAELEAEALGVPYDEVLRRLEEESRRSGEESEHGIREGIAF